MTTCRCRRWELGWESGVGVLPQLAETFPPCFVARMARAYTASVTMRGISGGRGPMLRMIEEKSPRCLTISWSPRERYSFSRLFDIRGNKHEDLSCLSRCEFVTPRHLNVQLQEKKHVSPETISHLYCENTIQQSKRMS